MTSEQLLRTRYKVIADYPQNPYKVGQILHPVKYLSGNWWVPGWIGKDIGHFPHLFQSLPWWQHRKLDEMPTYIKCEGIIHKATWSENNGIMKMHLEDTDWEVNANVMGHFEPATKEEYESYINKNNE